MATFRIRELQHVIVEREIEADTEDEALDAFNDGEGKECGRDGDVTSSTLLEIVAIEA